jgi:hypothetical protein
MIILTGDTHSDFGRFSSRRFSAKKGMTRRDYVIICGDFGGEWDASRGENSRLDWLEQHCPFTTLFVDGNHENYDLLAPYPIEEWHGGKVQRIRPSVLHLMRGQVYEICGKAFFTMGGAVSHDIGDGILNRSDNDFADNHFRLRCRNSMFRINHESWWKEELPGDEEYDEALRNLDRAGWSVDYVITHCAPTRIQAIVGDGTYAPDRLTDFLETISERCLFKKWFCGHYHINQTVEDRYILLYDELRPLEPADTVSGA